MSIAAERQWITGEEYGAERRRLIAQGCGYGSPEYRALQQKVSERNDYIWRTYAVPLLPHHPGMWVAVSVDGEVLLAERELDAMKLGGARFGPGNYLLARLVDDRGTRRIGPRSG